MTNVKIAYLLVAHKNPEQVNMFINQLLQYGACDVYVHVDKKNPDLFNKIISSPNVFKYSKYDVRWGSFEIVKAAVELMRMVKNSGRKYTHMYFGSGQDLLVKKGLYEYLENNSETVFLHIVGEIKDDNRESARYRICWPHKLMIRDDLHGFVCNENGFTYIGLNPADEIIESNLKMYLSMSKESRLHFHNMLLSHDLRGGRRRVMGLINGI